MSAAVITIAAKNQERVRRIKELAMALSHFYQGPIKIEVNINKENDIAKLNITEYNL